MAAILNAFAKSFGATVRLQRCIRPTTIESCRYFVASNEDNRPKKPRSTFLLYLESVRPQLTRENPGIKLMEVTKLASAQYKALSDAEKMKLRQLYEKQKAVYEKEKQDYLSGLSEFEKEKIETEKADRKKHKQKLRVKKEKKELNAPKKPPSSFSLFTREIWKNENTDSKRIEDMSKEISARWKSLSNSEKEFYNDLCKEESEKYRRDLQVWEDAMIKQNKLHLVRKSQLPEPKRKKVVSKKSAIKKVAGKKKAAVGKSKEENVAILGEHELSDSD